MKYFFTYIFALFITLGSAQAVLTLNPSLINATVKATDLEVVGKSTIKNVSKDTIIIKWSRKIESITQGWTSAVCDKNLCYTPMVDSMRLVLAPNEISNMDIYIYPGGISGAAKVTLTVEQVGKPDTKIVGNYLFNQTTPVRNSDKEAIQLYPNPTLDFFMISSPIVLGKIELYNITGERAKVYYAYKNKRYYIDDIPSGIYMVRLLNLKEEIIKTVILKKR